jgi:hypothetical protein
MTKRRNDRQDKNKQKNKNLEGMKTNKPTDIWIDNPCT